LKEQIAVQLQKTVDSFNYYTVKEERSTKLVMEIVGVMPEEVDKLELTLLGKDPLSGEPVEKKVAFSSAKKQATIKGLMYHGEFELKFIAQLLDGQRIDDLESNVKIALECQTNKPYISKPKLGKSKNGFTKITIKSNCWKTAKEHVWLKYNGHYQLFAVDESAGREVNEWLPTNERIEHFYPAEDKAERI
jgi:hypothetical protein